MRYAYRGMADPIAPISEQNEGKLIKQESDSRVRALDREGRQSGGQYSEWNSSLVWGDSSFIQRTLAIHRADVGIRRTAGIIFEGDGYGMVTGRVEARTAAFSLLLPAGNSHAFPSTCLLVPSSGWAS